MKPMYINGEWVSSSTGETLDVFDPATAAVIDSVPNGTAEDTVKAIEAAKAAFNEWRWVTALERCEMLHEAARKLRNHFDDFTHQTGIFTGEKRVQKGRDHPDTYAAHNREHDREHDRQHYLRQIGPDVLEHTPVGSQAGRTSFRRGRALGG